MHLLMSTITADRLHTYHSRRVPTPGRASQAKRREHPCLCVIEVVEMGDVLTFTTSVLAEILENQKTESGAESWTEVTKDMHMYPDLHGILEKSASYELRH